MTPLDPGEFYRRKLQRYAAVRVPVRAVRRATWGLRWRFMYPLLRRARRSARAVVPSSLLRAYLQLTGGGLGRMLLRWRLAPEPLVAQAASACSGTRVAVRELFPACVVQIAQPDAVPAQFADRVAPMKGEYAFPPVVLSEWKDAEVAGRTNMLRAGGAVIHHDLFRPSHDYTSEELHGRIFIDGAHARIWRYERPPRSREFARAALFTDAVAPNYAHWLTEVLPRLHAYGRAQPGNDAVVLLDAGLHRNLLCSAELVLPAGARIEQLAAGSVARVGELQVVSTAGYIPFEPRPGVVEGHSHGMFSAVALCSLRDHLAQAVGPAQADQPRRLLLRRSSTYRALRNEQELEEQLAPRGFVPVYPERLSFSEQFRLFSGAEIIVGATGAAMANLVFCPPTARVVICISAHRGHSFGYWQNLACAVGNRVHYVLGPTAGSSASGIHSDFRVDERDVMQAIEAP